MSRAGKRRHGEAWLLAALHGNGPEQQRQAAKCYGKAMIRTRNGREMHGKAAEMRRIKLQRHGEELRGKAWRSIARKGEGIARTGADTSRSAAATNCDTSSSKGTALNGRVWRRQCLEWKSNAPEWPGFEMIGYGEAKHRCVKRGSGMALHYGAKPRKRL